MTERHVVIGSAVGLHARPASLFVKAAIAAPVAVTIGKVDGESVDARSILSVLGLGARFGDEVVLAVADDSAPEKADAVLTELATLLATDHDAGSA
jgi:phosphocarrier protein HPr